MGDFSQIKPLFSEMSPFMDQNTTPISPHRSFMQHPLDRSRQLHISNMPSNVSELATPQTKQISFTKLTPKSSKFKQSMKPTASSN